MLEATCRIPCKDEIFLDSKQQIGRNSPNSDLYCDNMARADLAFGCSEQLAWWLKTVWAILSYSHHLQQSQEPVLTTGTVFDATDASPPFFPSLCPAGFLAMNCIPFPPLS
jgi:hypothetical protein